jgi:prepilin-type N-terminal cleavage/methylation domain-containing protein/prepilin-type processing-associated H-X9-DG protein
MKTSSGQKTNRAFNLIEVLVVVVVLLLLALFLFPSPPGDAKRKAIAVTCLFDLKQDSLALLTWGEEHHNALPWNVPSKNGGTMDLAATDVSSQFRAVSNLVAQPRMFYCSSDRSRRPAENFKQFADTNVSYFINLDAGGMKTSNAPRSVLMGDRSLEVKGRPILSGRVMMIDVGTDLAWGRGVHNVNGKPAGNIAFMDGHAERVVGNRLKDVICSQGGTNLFEFP